MHRAEGMKRQMDMHNEKGSHLRMRTLLSYGASSGLYSHPADNAGVPKARQRLTQRRDSSGAGLSRY